MAKVPLNGGLEKNTLILLYFFNTLYEKVNAQRRNVFLHKKALITLLLKIFNVAEKLGSFYVGSLNRDILCNDNRLIRDTFLILLDIKYPDLL